MKPEGQMVGRDWLEGSYLGIVRWEEQAGAVDPWK